MALIDKKISDAQIESAGVISAPDTLRGTAAENKAIFDRLVRLSIEASVNPVIDELAGPEGAASIGISPIDGVTADNAQEALESIKGIASTLPVATAATLGGVKQGQGVEIMADGTLNGLSAPAPDLVARAQIQVLQGQVEELRVVALTVTLLADAWEPMTEEEVAATDPGLTVKQEVDIPGLTGTRQVDVIRVPVAYVEGGEPMLWPVVLDGVCLICAAEAPTVDVRADLQIQEVKAI